MQGIHMMFERSPYPMTQGSRFGFESCLRASETGPVNSPQIISGTVCNGGPVLVTSGKSP